MGIPPDDSRWFEAQANASVRFQQTGELPEDDLHIEALLADIELAQLRAHKRGKDVTKAMGLLNTIARRGDEAAQALKQLCAMAVKGLL